MGTSAGGWKGDSAGLRLRASSEKRLEKAGVGSEGGIRHLKETWRPHHLLGLILGLIQQNILCQSLPYTT